MLLMCNVLYQKLIDKSLKNISMKNSWIVSIVFLFGSVLLGCSSGGGDSETKIIADFSFFFGNDNNHVVFANESSGDYYSLNWDFGQGSKESTSNKTKTFEVYYPEAGNYTVTLTVKDNNGNSANQSKTVVIEQNDPNYNPDGNLVWSDEFNGNTINTDNWTFETGDGGWGNQELQNYTNGDNAHIADGKLVITARKVNDNKVAGSYTSTRMISLGKQEFTYGRMEIKAKLPSGTGIWPAIWMLGANINTVGWPACGEIDIMEYVGFEPNTIHATVHTPSGYAGDGNGSSAALETAEEEFHIYGMIWDEDKIQFYVDTQDNITHTYSPSNKNAENWPFDKHHFFILNIAVGGTWGGAQGIDNSIFPQTMEIDYVRVYQ